MNDLITTVSAAGAGEIILLFFFLNVLFFKDFVKFQTKETKENIENVFRISPNDGFVFLWIFGPALVAPPVHHILWFSWLHFGEMKLTFSYISGKCVKPSLKNYLCSVLAWTALWTCFRTLTVFTSGFSRAWPWSALATIVLLRVRTDVTHQTEVTTPKIKGN